MNEKPLNKRNYGSIGHLPNSRRGSKDYGIDKGQSVICQEKARDKHDVIIVQEKLDGTNVGVAKVDGAVVAIGRKGYLANTSPFKMHRIFSDWVETQQDRFNFLEEGQRLVGEWLAYAHGTIYNLPHEPFVALDLMKVNERLTYLEFIKVLGGRFTTPRLISYGAPVSINWVLERLELDKSYHGAKDDIEGAVWRVERKGKVDFLAKYVRHGKVDGKYLKEDIWLWSPSKKGDEVKEFRG